MNKLILMVGAPASGKSIYTQALQQQGMTILSSDHIRQELFHDINDQSHNSLVFKTLYTRARALLTAGQDVVIDATNINRNMRAKALSQFADLKLYRMAIVFDLPLDTCVERDQARSRSVGRAVIEHYFSIYEPPDKSEGFDEIIYITE